MRLKEKIFLSVVIAAAIVLVTNLVSSAVTSGANYSKDGN
jgi:hypothetical protein